MGLFSGVVGDPESFPSNEPQAVLGILLSVIAADGDISDEEVDSFMYLANNTKSLGPMPANTFQQHVRTCLGILRREGSGRLVERCASQISAGKRRPLFVNSCDLIMRDGQVEAEEEQIVEALQRRLDIDDGFAKTTVATILTKYAL